ncbi:MAG: ABC transporter permease, partial [Acidobacteriota bacterium]
MGRSIALPPSARRLLRNPEGAILSILTLGLGIGAAAALFTIVHDVLVQPLPYPRSERLVGVSHTATGMFVDEFDLSEGSYLAFRDAAHTLEGLALVEEGQVSLTGEGVPERIPVARATPSLLPVLGVEPLVGRGFTDDEGRPGGEPAVLLSAGLWVRRFGSDPEVLGRRIEMDGVPRTVVGVLPPEVAVPSPEVEAWLPMEIDPSAPEVGAFGLRAVGRLAESVEKDAAERELTALVPRIAERFPGGGVSASELERIGLGVRVRPLRQVEVGEVGEILWPLFGGCGILFLIACGNVTNLMLVRTRDRSREMAVRSALGAGRWRTAGDLLGEALLLALGGAVVGLGLAVAGVESLRALGPERLPRLQEVAVGAPAVGFVLVATALSALAFGVIPAFRHSAPDLAGSLAEAGRGASPGRRRLRGADLLVAGQIALALVLVSGGGLMVRSYRALSSVDPGFDPDGVLTFRLELPPVRYGDAAARARTVDRILARLRGIPGVDEA